jgi:sarcosine oxidase / L-pipecolate oxidase
MSRIIVVGAGINGVTAAIELKKRGHDVVLVDPGPLPHPLAASTDISKAVRAAYGADEDYTALAECSTKLWRKWNQEFGTQLYHEVGVMFVRQRELKPGDFEYESFKTLEHRGHKIERINSARSWKRFPAWNPELYLDGVLELEAGYAESGRVVATLIRRAKSLGIELLEGTSFSKLDENDDGVSGIVVGNGERIASDFVVMAVGAWTPYLLPFTKKFFRASGQPVFHLQPRQPELFGFRRRHYNHRLLRISNQSRWRLEDRKSRSRPRDVAGIFETCCHSRG